MRSRFTPDGSSGSSSAPTVVLLDRVGMKDAQVFSWSQQDAMGVKDAQALTFAEPDSIGVKDSAVITGEGTPQWQSVQTAQRAGLGTLTITKPTGTASGDLLVAHISVDSDPNYPTPPAGWTLIQEATSPGSATVMARSWYKIAGGSEPASYDFGISNCNGAVGAVHRVSGAHATTPINASAIATLNATALVPDPVSPSVTTTVVNCLLIRFLAHSHLALTQTHTPAAGHTERTDQESSSSVIVSGTSKTIIQAAAAASGTAVHDCTETVATDAVMTTVAVAPGAITIVL